MSTVVFIVGHPYEIAWDIGLPFLRFICQLKIAEMPLEARVVTLPDHSRPESARLW